MSGRNLNLVALGGLFGLAAILTAPAQGQVYESVEHDFRVVTVAEDIQHPWSIAFLPDGDMLFTQRTGELRIVRDGELLPDPVEGVPETRVINQGGLQEIALHPDFENNRIVYVSYSKPNGSRGTTALIRARFENDRLEDVEEIFEADAWNERGGHFGAKIAFDEDGYLYLTDRSAFMIISGGVNIYPQEIEACFALHPKVADVAVFGLPDPEMGEYVHAVVQPEAGLEPSDGLAEELRAFARAEIAHYKVPRVIDFRAELPRLPTGKLYKKPLRQEYLDRLTGD